MRLLFSLINQKNNEERTALSLVAPKEITNLSTIFTNFIYSKNWENSSKKMAVDINSSDQAEGKTVGAHRDYVESIPDEQLQLMKTGYEFDIMIEAKIKDLAVFKLLKKY